MPSAQHVEIDELSGAQANGDLHSLLRELHASNVSNLNSLHGRGKVLIAEGDPAEASTYCERAELPFRSRRVKDERVILRMAQPGDVLGLNSVLRNSLYDATVKTLEPCRTDFISRCPIDRAHGAKAKRARTPY